MNITIKVLFMHRSGKGNAQQQSVISPAVQEYSDYQFSLINNNNENFVIFDNEINNNCDQHSSTSGFALGDIMKFMDIIYEISLKKLLQIPIDSVNEDLNIIVELDAVSVGNNILRAAIYNDRATCPTTAGIYSKLPITLLFFETLANYARASYKKINFELNYRDYTPTECTSYFFPNCNRANTDKCCKVNK